MLLLNPLYQCIKLLMELANCKLVSEIEIDKCEHSNDLKRKFNLKILLQNIYYELSCRSLLEMSMEIVYYYRKLHKICIILSNTANRDSFFYVSIRYRHIFHSSEAFQRDFFLLELSSNIKSL